MPKYKIWQKQENNTLKYIGVIDSDFLNGNTDVEVKNLKAHNIDLHYTKPDGTTGTGKVKSELTPDVDRLYNLGSSSKAWQKIYFYQLYLNFKKFVEIENNIVKIYRLDGTNKMLSSGGDFEGDNVTLFGPKNKIKLHLYKDRVNMVNDGVNFLEILNGFFRSQGIRVNKNAGYYLKLDDDNGYLFSPSKFDIVPDDSYNEGASATRTKPLLRFGGLSSMRDENGNTMDRLLETMNTGTINKGVLITKDGTFYYNGKKLEDWFEGYNTAVNSIQEVEY